MSYPDTLQDEISHDRDQAHKAAARDINPVVSTLGPISDWESAMFGEYALKAECEMCGAKAGRPCKGYVPIGEFHGTRMTSLPGNWSAWRAARAAEAKRRFRAWLDSTPVSS